MDQFQDSVMGNFKTLFSILIKDDDNDLLRFTHVERANIAATLAVGATNAEYMSWVGTQLEMVAVTIAEEEVELSAKTREDLRKIFMGG